MITKSCPAKINLFLKVINKRCDGYHNLLSVITKINLCDQLSVGISDHFSLKIFGQFENLINPKNNLLTSILNYFQEKYSITNNLKIILEKNIPVGAGLGGGSSDACSFMKILNEIFNLNLTKSELQKISLNFGSDIAFFFEETTQMVMNRGETLHDYNDLEKLEIVLIYPQINLSTKKIFQDYAKHNLNHLQLINAKNNFLESANNFSNTLSQQQIFDLENDLEKIAVIHAPIIQEIKDNMQNLGSINCKMSGSGSAVFAIYANFNEAQMAFKKLQEIYPNFFIKYLQNF